MSGDVVLLGAVHDPEGRIAALLPADLPLLQHHYARIVAICGMATLPSTVTALQRYGVTVISGTDIPIPINARPYALGVMASHAEWEYVHLCDFDSALHWARCWPNELDVVNATIAAHDFLLLGRTARAMASLPEAQRETERLINLLFAHTTGGLDPWRLGNEPDTLIDICTGAWGFSQRGIAALHARAHVTDIGFHAEWPLIARDTPGLRCAYLPCEGLEYETADRYGDQIAAAGGIEAWHARQNADIRHWQQRIAYITQIAEAILH
ncbi:MAG: hypothetical protein M3Z19_12410 [Chloroflexota bacterium]|nr:hypothetical protein [Chloroflexota bacterium]